MNNAATASTGSVSPVQGQVDFSLEQRVLSGQGFTRQDVESVLKGIDLQNPQTILSITQSCTREAGSAVDDILKSIRADSLPQLDSLVSQIIDEGVEAQKAVKGGAVSKIMDVFSSTVSIAKRRIESARRAHDSMYERCVQIRKKIDSHVDDEYTSIRTMQAVVAQRRDAMRRTVIALVAEKEALDLGQKRLEALRAQAQSNPSHDLELSISSLNSGLTLLMNSIDTLESYRTLLYNGVMEALTTAMSSYRLIATVTSSADIAIQNIKENAAVYSTGEKTKVALDFERRLNEMSNKLARDTSDMVRKNALETTKALVTPAITPETIEHGCENLISSTQETRAVITQWLSDRQVTNRRIEAVRARLKDVVVGGNLVPSSGQVGNAVTPTEMPYQTPSLSIPDMSGQQASSQPQTSTFRF